MSSELLHALNESAPEWMREGLCTPPYRPAVLHVAERAGYPTVLDMFFTDRGNDTKPAKGVCADCPVRIECLEYALTAGIHFGIWGGMSARERKRIRRQRRAAERAS